MHEQPHERPPSTSIDGRAAFAAPRLELPRFQLGSTRPAASPEPMIAPYRSRALEHAQARTPQPTPSWNSMPTSIAAQPAVYAARVAAPVMHATTAIPLYVAPQLRAPRHAPASPMTNATQPARVTYAPAPAAAAPAGLLQRITPMHMGVLLVFVMVAMVVSSGPGAMRAQPTRLPALASGSGTNADPLLQPRAGSTAVAAATSAGSTRRAAATTRRAATRAARTSVPATARAPKLLAVGSARLDPNVRSGGIPSPAAAANLAVQGGGRVVAADTGTLRLAGMPSPAAAEQLGPATLPFRPSDGVTLPRGFSDRDSHAVDSHYGNDTLAMDDPVELPALTPGAAAARAERQVTRNELSSGSTPPQVSGGLIIAS